MAETITILDSSTECVNLSDTANSEDIEIINISNELEQFKLSTDSDDDALLALDIQEASATKPVSKDSISDNDCDRTVSNVDLLVQLIDESEKEVGNSPTNKVFDNDCDKSVSNLDLLVQLIDEEERKVGNPISSKALQILNNVFKCERFRKSQLEAINATVSRRDCLIVMPTGAGKSLCYQIPALIDDGLTVVISPLRSLITDQMEKLNSRGVPVASLTSDLSKKQTDEVYRDLLSHKSKTKILYVTPEVVAYNGRFNKVLVEKYSRHRLDRFVVDEAHCILEWGGNFRKAYTDLKLLKKRFSQVPIMALTASATETALIDIVHHLKLKNCQTFLSSFDRPNIKYVIKPKTASTIKDTVEFIHSTYEGCSGVLYCLSQNECEKSALTLRDNGIPAVAYHAGMTTKEREEAQKAWMQDKIKVIAATVAFGMGIDKSNVRFVIHLTMPKSMESYYQEAGRCGRDGEIAHSIMYYKFSDSSRWLNIFPGDGNECAKNMDSLLKMIEFLENETTCRRFLLLKHFGESEQCGQNAKCDVCETGAENFDVDVSKETKAIVGAIPLILNNLTITHLCNILKGSSQQSVIVQNHDKLHIHGLCKKWKRSHIEALLHQLITKKYIGLNKVNGNFNNGFYLKSGSNAKNVELNWFKMELTFKKETDSDSEFEHFTKTIKSRKRMHSEI